MIKPLSDHLGRCQMENQKRSYNSVIRRKQAEDTRERIAQAADELIKQNGYENTTIGAIADRAGVATQTVYAIFGSKQGILMHLLKQTMRQNQSKDEDYIRTSMDECEFAARVAFFARRRNEREHSTMSSLGGFEMLYPELCALVVEADALRRSMIEKNLDKMTSEEEKELLPKDGVRSKKLDLLWALTDGSLFHHLTERAGWSSDDYEKALASILRHVMSDMKFE